MAGSAVTIRQEFPTNSQVGKMLDVLKKVIVDLEKLRVAVDTIADKLDVDGGVTATDFATSADVATASELVAYDINTHF